MANDFTASVIPILRAQMDTIFKSQATVNPELTKEPIAAAFALQKQTVSLDPLKSGLQDACTGVRVIYNVADDTAVPTMHATAQDSTCSLTTGDGLSTAYHDFDFNLFSKEAIKVNDKDCANFVKFMERSAFLLAHKMSMMVQSFNAQVVTHLEANKSTVSATDLPDGVTVPASGNYTIATAGAWSGLAAADTLATLDQLARVRGLPNNYYIISGKALRVPADIATDHAANDNERSYHISFLRRDIAFDEDQITGDYLYLVDPNAVVSYFLSTYPAEGQSMGDKDNTTVFSLPLQYYSDYQQGGSAMKTLQVANAGILEDAKIDVRYQKACNTSIARYGKPSLDHIWELDLVGLFDLVPAVGDNTGIIRVDKA